MIAPLLSAAMIVRDEERHLEECLRSIRPVVDEIVIVDTGSKDRSMEIAREFDARIHSYRWHDDFAAARNFGLDRCAGAWILYIDADERIRPHSKGALAELLADPTRVGYTVGFHPLTGFTPFREMRLFRNDPRIRFEGVMHETMWPGIQRHMSEENSRLGDSELVLDHIGYDGHQSHKHARDLPLLKKALAEDPSHVHCWYHLGRVYQATDQPALAHEAWRSGIEAVRAKPMSRPADSLPYLELARDLILHEEDPGEVLVEARQKFPLDPMLIWLE